MSVHFFFLSNILFSHHFIVSFCFHLVSRLYIYPRCVCSDVSRMNRPIGGYKRAKAYGKKEMKMKEKNKPSDVGLRIFHSTLS